MAVCLCSEAGFETATAPPPPVSDEERLDRAKVIGAIQRSAKAYYVVYETRPSAMQESCELLQRVLCL